jgi:hypothetical protein
MDAETLPAPVFILGVNEAGQESGNALVCAGRDLPWLQDDGTTDAWRQWGVTFRDVVILDRHQEVHAIYNLTSHNLAIAGNREELRALLRSAAAVP